MIFRLDGCALDPSNPVETGPDSARCRASRARLKALLEDLFAARFRPPLYFKVPLGPPPPLADILKVDPDLQSSIPDFYGRQNALNGELLSIALRQPTPTPAIKELRDSGLVIEAATEVLSQLRSATSALEEEIEELKQCEGK